MSDKKEFTIKIMISLISIAMIIALVIIGSINAEWKYAYASPQPKNTTYDIYLGNWTYVEEETPDSGIADSIIGGGGSGTTEPDPGGTTPDQPTPPPSDQGSLNDSQSSLNSNIEYRKQNGYDTFSSLDSLNGGDVRSELGLTQDDIFILHFPANNPNVMYLYSTKVVSGIRSFASFFPKNIWYIPQGERVYPVYKDTLVKGNDGRWRQTKTEVGSAESGTYKSDIVGLWEANNPCFDHTTWRAETLGYSKPNAIYSYIGQSINVKIKNETDKKYYKFVGNGANVSVISSSSNVNIKITDQNDKVYNSTSIATKTNSTYYIEVSGEKKFNISIN